MTAMGWHQKIVIFFVFFVFIVFQGYAADAGVKKIAVLDFEDAAVSAHFQARNFKIGRAVADILVTELVKDGTFKVIERSQLEKVISEQKLSASGLVDTSEVAKIGKILGVSAVIVGSVTQFGIDSKVRGIFGIGIKQNYAKVAVNARLIDTTTAEILNAAEGSAEESASGVSIEGLANIDASNMANTILGTATKNALANIVKQFKEQSAKLKEAAINAKVAYVDKTNKTCIIDAGKDHGVANDTIFYVVKVVKEIKSPKTGAVIKRLTDVVAELKVIEVEGSNATLLCVSGKCDTINENDDVSTSK